MRDLIDPALRFILGLALILLIAMTLLKPVATPLLIDAAVRPQDQPSLLFVPCPLMRRNLPNIDDRKA